MKSESHLPAEETKFCEHGRKCGMFCPHCNTTVGVVLNKSIDYIVIKASLGDAEKEEHKDAKEP